MKKLPDTASPRLKTLAAIFVLPPEEWINLGFNLSFFLLGGWCDGEFLLVGSCNSDSDGFVFVWEEFYHVVQGLIPLNLRFQRSNMFVTTVPNLFCKSFLSTSRAIQYILLRQLCTRKYINTIYNIKKFSHTGGFESLQSMWEKYTIPK